MSIESFIESICVQTAVYWGNPTPDGYGGKTYDPPVEIKCRWDYTTELISDAKGIERVCRAVILVTQDLVVQGMLYLGTLDELDSDDEENPLGVDGVCEIIRFDKTPMIRSTSVFVRKAYV